MRKFAALACVLLCNVGCTAVGLGPDRVYSVDQQVAELQKARTNPLPKDFSLYDFVSERMYEIDLEYNVYFAKLTNDTQLGNLAGDLALLGLTASSTFVPATATKTILSATARGVGGAKTAVNQDVLLSHTIQILLTQMETSRALIKNRILANADPAKKGTPPYNYWTALSDLEDYYRAGTIPGALEALAAATGSNAQNAKNCKNGTTQSGQAVKCAKLGKSKSATTGVTSFGASVPALQ